MKPSGVMVWILAARPKTLPAAAAPVLIGSVMAYADGGFHLLSATAALIGALMIQIGTNYSNDYVDFLKGSDREDRLGPTRATAAGWVTPGAMKTATGVAFGLAFVAGMYLVYRGGWPIVVIGLLSILFGVVYTAGPFPLGYNGLGDIFVLIFFGPVAVGGTYYVQTLDITRAVLLIGLSPGLFSTAILTVNNLRDIDADRESGKKTLAVRFGRTFARVEYVLCVAIACIIPVVLMFQSESNVWSLLPLLVIPFAIPTIRTVFTSTDGRRLNDMLASTGRLLFLFSLLFSIGWLL